MKKFIKKCIIFICIFSVIVVGLDILSAIPPFREKLAIATYSSDYPATERDDIAIYIEQVREQGDYTKLVIGDSVCGQMVNGLREYNKEYSLVGNNRALSLAGEYLLIKEFLEKHDNVTDVYLMVGLDALQTNIDVIYGYQYVTIPFSREGMIHNLDQETIKQMNRNFGRFFMLKPITRLIGCSSVNRKVYLNYLKDYAKPDYGSEGPMSYIAYTYLPKINEICQENNVRLHLLPDPLADNEWRHEQTEMLEKDFKDRGFDKMFPDYFNDICYYPENQFGDGIHFCEPYDTQKELNNKLKEIYLEKGYMGGLVLEP